MQIREVAVTPFTDQRPGTAGLRKKVSVFQQPHYLECFVEAVLRNAGDLRGTTLIVGGDGRYHNHEAIQTILAMLAAHGAGRVIVGQGGLLSTPAASSLIRDAGASGGFLLTASHNPAGPEGDFGIKYNIASGGQASEQLTEAIYATSQSLNTYRIAELPVIDIDRLGSNRVGGMQLEVADPVTAYARQMQGLFDFAAIRKLFERGFRLRYDAMHAVTGPYAQRILCEQLGAPAESIVNATPLQDFGGGHPDPNLVYASELVNCMAATDAPDFGAASDGDGDRNMILGRGCFVSPGDSLAVLAAHATDLPGYAAGLPGVARSMPTSRAIDLVAQRLDIPCYVTPTGWRFFCNLLEDGRIGFCGEESFGTSSHHSREKDGLWAVLAWLNLLAIEGQPVAGILQQHWQRYGRHYYQRQDYENLDLVAASGMLERLRGRLAQLIGQALDGQLITEAGDFAYHDPVDDSRSEGQGIQIIMGPAARIVVRLSGTGTQGATLRLYLERYCQDQIDLPPAQALATLARNADSLLGLEHRAPDLVT